MSSQFPNTNNELTPEPVTMPRPRRRLNILVAEDTDLTRQLICRLLQMRGHVAVGAASGVEVLEKLPKEQFDAILMDMEMPGLDGLETTRTIRSVELLEEERHPIPIVAMTAHDDQQSIASCLESGMDEYIPKPVQLERLHSVVEEIVLLSDHAHLQSKLHVMPPGETARVLVSARSRIREGILTNILNRAGIEYRIGRTDREVEELARGERFDVCLLDLVEAGSDPLHLCRRLRGRNSSEELPIVAVCLPLSPVDAQDWRAAGVNEFLASPLQPDQLVSSLKEMLRGRTKAISPITDAPSQNDSEWINRAEIRRRVEGDPLFLHEMIELYKSNVADLLSLADETLAAEDWYSFCRTIHALRSPVGSFTTGRPLRLLERIAMLVETEETAEVEKTMAALHTVLAELERQLDLFAAEFQSAEQVRSDMDSGRPSPHAALN